MRKKIYNKRTEGKMLNKKLLIALVISDVLLLYFTLFLYEYPWVAGLTPIFWTFVCIVINIIFLIHCLLKKRFVYLILLIIPIILISLMNNRIDRNVLVYLKLIDAKKELGNIEKYNEQILNEKRIYKFVYNGNTLYTFRNFAKWENLEGTDRVEPDCRIIYAENDFLDTYMGDDKKLDLTGIDRSAIIEGRGWPIRKLERNWYFAE